MWKNIVFIIIMTMVSSVVLAETPIVKDNYNEKKLRNDPTVLISLPRGARVIDVPQKETPILKTNDLIVKAHVETEDGYMNSPVSCIVIKDTVTCDWN